MRIGILTLYHKNYNYGGQLQAYALQKYLDKFGDTVELIDYNQYPTRRFDKWIDRVCRNYRILFQPKKIKQLKDKSAEAVKNKNQYKEALQARLKAQKSSIEKFELFMNQIPHTACYNRHSIKELSDTYDIVILGGDQIWNPNYFFKQYYGTWIRDKKTLISYSASAGKDNFEKYELCKQLKLISKIPQISVREENFEALLKEKLKRNDIVSVVDPVFLIDVEAWNDIASSPQISGKYIFAYLLNKDANSRLKITEYAKEVKLPIVTIPHARGEYNSCDEGFGDIAKYDVGPLEFLGLIKNAECIFTDSFHGTCFSIIFHKRFYTIENSALNKTTNARLKTILHKSGLMNRMMELNNSMIDEYPIDYTEVDTVLHKQIRESEQWLDNAICNVSNRSVN